METIISSWVLQGYYMAPRHVDNPSSGLYFFPTRVQSIIGAMQKRCAWALVTQAALSIALPLATGEGGSGASSIMSLERFPAPEAPDLQWHAPGHGGHGRAQIH